MLVPGFLLDDFADWTTWLILAVGVTVTIAVFVLLSRSRRRRRLAEAEANEDIAWEHLLERLRSRHRELAAPGPPGQDDMPPEEMLSLLLSQRPAKAGGRSADMPPGERQFLEKGGTDRRSNRRRWGNPTEVYLNSPLVSGRLRGLVINRSAPGLAIFVNQEVPPGTTLAIRAVEAPDSIPSVEIAVKYCRKTQRNYIIGCQSPQEIPWNIRGWFG